MAENLTILLWGYEIIPPDEALFFFSNQNLLFFLFLHEHICCDYFSEAPGEQLMQMSTYNISFCGEIRKIFL